MSTRLSAEELDAIEATYHRGVVVSSLIAEVRASWGAFADMLAAERGAGAESVRLREALRALVDALVAHKSNRQTEVLNAMSAARALLESGSPE